MEDELCRLNKFIAGANVCSRRKADELIQSGRVSVNGKTVTELGVKVASGDVVMLDGNKLKSNDGYIYIMLNKPTGCVTTASDQFGRKTVMDYVRDIKTRVFPVGRLDYNTSGLLILTNDGDFANKLMHPKNKTEKTYIVKVKSKPAVEELTKLRRGVVISENSEYGDKGGIREYKTAPARVSVIEIEKDGAVLEITIREGRNRQVRKMCEAVNCSVISLHRISVGSLSLGDLKPGSHRYLTAAEVRKLSSNTFGSKSDTTTTRK